MANTNDDLKALKSAIEAGRKLRATEEALRAEDARLGREIKAIEHANASQEEVIDAMRRLVNQERARFLEFGRGLVSSLTPHSEARGRNDSTLRKVPPRLPNFSLDGKATVDFVIGMLHKHVAESLEEVIRECGANFGLPAAERAAKLAELTEQRTVVQRQHTELVDAAAEVGIVLALLPAVKERREAEALELERQRELEAQRAAGIYPVVFHGN